MSTRRGGVSGGLFDSMNLGDHVGDDPLAVSANRARLAQSLQARPVFMRQVHGATVQGLDTSTAWGIEADGAFTQTRHQACVVMVADCLPILLAHEGVPVVAALHAGWRGLAGAGLAQGIVEAGWEQLRRATGLSDRSLSAGLLAWLGPCIGPQAFEVGAEVCEAFTREHSEARGCFQSVGGNKFLADLPQLARQRLQRLGLERIYGNDGSAAWCTASQSRFFSHRRVSQAATARPGDTGGRMAACIWLD